MHILRVTRSTIQRRRWQSRRPKNSDVPHGQQLHRLCGRRRSFSESTQTTNRSAAYATTDDNNNNNNLERFTSYALNSHSMPLGSMNENQWEDSMVAVDHWSRLGGGFAVDSAERLLHRLSFEHAVISPHVTSYASKTRALAEMRKVLLQSWMEIHQENQESMLALVRAEKVVNELMENVPSVPEVFPFHEFCSVVQGWLRFQTPEGARNAAKLLLRITENANHKNFVDLAGDLNPLFEQTLAQILEQKEDLNNEAEELISVEFLDRINFLNNTEDRPKIQIPEASQKMMLEASLIQNEDKNMSDKVSITSLESEAIEKRMIDLLKMSGRGDGESVEKIVDRLNGISPGKDLIVSLIEFYVRDSNPEKASRWLDRLDAQTLLSTTQESPVSVFEMVLRSWSEQRDKRAPWRADEMFRQVFQIVQAGGTKASTLNNAAFNLLFNIWVNSKDAAASRKIQDWYAKMLQIGITPSVTSLKLVLKASLMEANAKSITIKSIATKILDQWSGFSDAEKLVLAESVIRALIQSDAPSSSVLEILSRLKEENIQPSQFLFHSCLKMIKSDSSSPTDVLRLTESLEQLGAGDLSFYLAVIQTLFRFGNDASKEIDDLFNRALYKCGFSSDDQTLVGEFLVTVLSMYTKQGWYRDARTKLLEAEELLLSKSPKAGDVSPIPLDCYRKIIVQHWYSDKNAAPVEDTFHHLMHLYRSGYSNLRPDRKIFAGYIQARAITTNDAEEIEKCLDLMLQLFEESGDDSCKPDTKIFNTVLLAILQDQSKAGIAGSKAMRLLQLMDDLGTKPNTKAINLVMQNVMKKGEKGAYTIILGLFQKLENYDAEPDSYALHCLLNSCGMALPEEHDAALKTCLETFSEIRKNKEVGPITYGVMSKVLRRIAPKGAKADKICASTMILCSEDGHVTRQVKDNIKVMVSDEIWKKIYTCKLSDDNREPSEWSRNAPKRSPKDGDS